jgi:paraquat-inducible protein B
VVTTDASGRQFVLRAQDLGSLDIGSPVYYRRVQVGQVVAYQLEPNGRDITLRVFVNKPYDKLVTATRASGTPAASTSSSMPAA